MACHGYFIPLPVFTSALLYCLPDASHSPPQFHSLFIPSPIDPAHGLGGIFFFMSSQKFSFSYLSLLILPLPPRILADVENIARSI